MSEASALTVVRDLAEAGFTAHVDGSLVVLIPEQAAALVREVWRLRERVERAEAPPY